MSVTQDNYENLSDSEVLALAGNLGPSIIGQELYEKAQEIKSRTGDGKFGPAIMDPHYADKQLAARAAAPASSESDPPVDDSDPWSTVTRSGAKQLAMDAGISYAPNIKTVALIETLKAAGVQPPAAPPKE